MLTKSPYKFSHFQQTLSNGKKVLDFESIANERYFMNILITPRGTTGKTFNVKEYIRKRFQKHGKKAIWLMNTQPLLEKQRDDFVKDFNKSSVRELLDPEIIQFWNDIEWKGDISKNTGRFEYQGQTFIKFLALNHAELMKGARDEWDTIVYEEFNVKANIVHKPIEKFDSLLHSLEDLVAKHKSAQDIKFFIFGNNKTLNNPIINRMGIRVLQEEISELRAENGMKLALVIAPQFDEIQREQIEEENSSNSIFQLSKIMGTHDHSYFNESLHDELNRVVQYTESAQMASLLQPVYTLIHKGEYINIYKIKGTNRYHLVNIDKYKDHEKVLQKVIYNKRDAEEDTTYNSILKKNMFIALSNDILTFEDITTRDYFISSIQ